MHDDIFSVLEVISVLITFSIGLLTLGEKFRKSGFFTNAKYALSVICPVIFVKFIILCGANYIIHIYIALLICIGLFSLLMLLRLVRDYHNDYHHKTFKSFVKESFECLEPPLLFLIFPVYGLILNLNPVSKTDNVMQQFVSSVQSQKISFNFYVFLENNLLYTFIFVLKFVEIYFMIYGTFIAFADVYKQRIPPRTTYKVLILGILISIVFSTNLHFDVIKLLLEQFG